MVSVGDTFGRLTVKEINGRKALCECACGKSTFYYLSHLQSGDIKSCGCLMKEKSAERMSEITEREREKANETKEEKYRVEETLSFSCRKRRYRNNTTGVKGVWRHGDKFIASIQVNGKSHYLGVFSTVEEAAKARKEGEKKYFDPILEEEKRRLNKEETP